MTETGKLYVNKDRTLLLWVSVHGHTQITSLDGTWVHDGNINPNDGTWDEIALPSKPFKPLDVPEESRKIRATLRSGEVVETIVKTLDSLERNDYITFESPTGFGLMFLNLTDSDDEDVNDIMEWEYVKEWVNNETEVYTPEGDWHGKFRTVEAAQEYVAMKNGEK